MTHERESPSSRHLVSASLLIPVCEEGGLSTQVPVAPQLAQGVRLHLCSPVQTTASAHGAWLSTGLSGFVRGLPNLDYIPCQAGKQAEVHSCRVGDLLLGPDSAFSTRPMASCAGGTQAAWL